MTIEQMKANLKRLLEVMNQAWQKTGSPLINKINEKVTHLGLKEKIAKFLPGDLAKRLPKDFDPLAVAEFTSRMFQRQGASFYGKVITILLSTYFLGDLVGIVASRWIPEVPPARPRTALTTTRKIKTVNDFNAIFARNLFNSQKLIPGDETPGGNGQIDLGGAPVRTTLPFNLIGTLILRDEIKSIATIEDKSANTVYPVRIQDEIPTKAKILEITARKVIFVNLGSGRREFVDLPQDNLSTAPKVSLGFRPTGGGQGVERVSPTQFNISRTELDKTMTDLNSVLTQARCVPSHENGLPAGYKCFQIVPGSIYDKLGIQNGDVVTAINGQNMNDPTKAIEQLSSLKEAKHVELTLKRDGRTMNYSYDIQ